MSTQVCTSIASIERWLDLDVAIIFGFPAIRSIDGNLFVTKCRAKTNGVLDCPAFSFKPPMMPLFPLGYEVSSATNTPIPKCEV